MECDEDPSGLKRCVLIKVVVAGAPTVCGTVLLSMVCIFSVQYLHILWRCACFLFCCDGIELIRTLAVRGVHLSLSLSWLQQDLQMIPWVFSVVF